MVVLIPHGKIRRVLYVALLLVLGGLSLVSFGVVELPDTRTPVQLAAEEPVDAKTEMRELFVKLYGEKHPGSKKGPRFKNPIKKESDIQAQSVSQDSSLPGYLSDTVLKAHYDDIDVSSFMGMRPFDEKKNYYKDQYCPKIEYTPDGHDRMMGHTASRLLTDDLEGLNEYLRTTGYGKLIHRRNNDFPEDQDLSKVDMAHLADWFRFTGSSVWIPEENVHLLASRLLYAPSKWPVMSFIRLQLYDADWKELKGRRVLYVDADESEVKYALGNYSQSGKEADLDTVSMTFPTILDIDLFENSRKDLLGPEDPRMFYNTVAKVHEPVIIFNQATNEGRSMHITFPLRKNAAGQKKTTLRLHTALMGQGSFEKNWTPFFDTLEPSPPAGMSGSVYLLYDIDPLRVYRCSLDTGDCSIVQQEGAKAPNPRGDKLTVVRGATSLIPIPRRVVQRLLRREGILEPNYPLQMWIGFVKAHLNDCGCGHLFYRPSLMVLVKQEHSFRVDVLTDCLDFDMDVMAWDNHDSVFCDDGNSVLNPNEIAFWHVSSEGPLDQNLFDINSQQLPHYTDYLGLTLSEADENVRVIFLKNVLNYIVGAYRYGHLVLSKKDVMREVRERTKKVETCMLRAAARYCEVYSVTHKKPPAEEIQ